MVAAAFKERASPKGIRMTRNVTMVTRIVTMMSAVAFAVPALCSGQDPLGPTRLDIDRVELTRLLAEYDAVATSAGYSDVLRDEGGCIRWYHPGALERWRLSDRRRDRTVHRGGRGRAVGYVDGRGWAPGRCPDPGTDLTPRGVEVGIGDTPHYGTRSFHPNAKNTSSRSDPCIGGRRSRASWILRGADGPTVERRSDVGWWPPRRSRSRSDSGRAGRG